MYTDALQNRLGVVLIQKDKVIVYASQHLKKMWDEASCPWPIIGSNGHCIQNMEVLFVVSVMQHLYIQ